MSISELAISSAFERMLIYRIVSYRIKSISQVCLVLLIRLSSISLGSFCCSFENSFALAANEDAKIQQYVYREMSIALITRRYTNVLS